MKVAAFARSLCALLLACSACGVAAQRTVYRCGPGGTEYTAVPCADGQAVDVGDSRSIEQRRQAQAAARREQQMADQMSAQRRKAEAAAGKPTAAGRQGAPASAPAKAASKAKSDPPRKKSSDAVTYASPQAGKSSAADASKRKTGAR